MRNKIGRKVSATIVLSLLIASTTNLVYVQGATKDDVYELMGEGRTDELFSVLEKRTIMMEYSKIENHNKLARILNSYNADDTNKQIEEERKVITDKLNKAEKELEETFSSGGKVDKVKAKLSTVTSLAYEIGKIREVGVALTLEPKENPYTTDYAKLKEAEERLKLMTEIGLIGLDLNFPVHKTKKKIKMYRHFGYGVNPATSNYESHRGIDIEAKENETVFNVWNGIVTAIYEDRLLGKGIEIKHSDGLVTRIYQLKSVAVAVGDTVEQGVKVGNAGLVGESVAVHVHLEVEVDGQLVNPLYFFGKNGTNAYKQYASLNEVALTDQYKKILTKVKDYPKHTKELMELAEENPVSELVVDFDKVRGEKKEGTTELQIKEGHTMPQPNDVDALLNNKGGK